MESLVVVVEIQYFHPLMVVVACLGLDLAPVGNWMMVVVVEHSFCIADDFQSYCQYVNFEEVAEDGMMNLLEDEPF